MKRTPKPENLAKLTPEQRAVFDAWQREAEKSDVLMQGLLDALAANDKIALARITDELDRLIPVVCEHGHSVYLSCMECEEIERTVFPENFNAKGERLMDGLTINEILSGRKPDKMLN
jgi:uncharacterized Ntn-hydrolase superfamily protein